MVTVRSVRVLLFALLGSCLLPSCIDDPSIVVEWGEEYRCEYLGEIRRRCVSTPRPDHGHCIKVVPPTPCIVDSGE
jgi:hypothetical protein